MDSLHPSRNDSGNGSKKTASTGSWQHLAAAGVPHSLENLESRVLLSVALDAAGWTEVTPTADSRIIYVSATQGNDTNTGLSSTAAVKTLGKAVSMLRSGSADQLLLRRGDVWSESLSLGSKSGLSTDDPLLISYYGADSAARPAVKGGISLGGNYVDVIGLHLDGPGKFTSPSGTGVSLPSLAVTNHIFMEDMLVEGYAIGLNLRNGHNTTLRRSVIVDNAKQGIYTTDNDGLFVMQNVFDNNGIDKVLQHNIYKARGGNNLVFTDNIFANGANFGLKMRALTTNAVVKGNLFYGNQNDFKVHLDSDDPETWLNQNIDVGYNVFLNTGKYDQQNQIYIDHTQGVNIHDNVLAHAHNVPYTAGIWLGALVAPNSPVNIKDATIANNIIYDSASEGIRLGTSNYSNVKITGNIIDIPTNPIGHITGVQSGSIDPTRVTYANNTYQSAYPSSQWFELGSNKVGLTQWLAASKETGAKTGRVNFSDPNRDLSTYQSSLGKTASGAAFLAAARNMSKQTWAPTNTASAVVRYIRDGFDLPTDGGTPTPPPTSGDTTAPTASLQTPAAVTDGAAAYEFAVAYNDNVAINSATIDNNDIKVTGPNGFQQTAQFVSVATSGSSTVATYRITAPGGTWDAADAGSYTIALLASQVGDASGNYAAAANLGTFTAGQSAPVGTEFSDVPTYGDLASYQLTTPSRWSVATDGGDARLFLNTSDFSGTPSGIPTELAVANTTALGDFSLKVQARANESLGSNSKADYVVVFGYEDPNNFLFACLRSDAGGSSIHKVANGQLSKLATAAATDSAFTDSNYHEVSVNRVGPVVTVSVDGQQLMQANDALAATVGLVGVGSYNDSAYFDNLAVTAAGDPTPPPGDTVDPTAALVAAVDTSDAAAYLFDVLYSDDVAVDPASISSGNIAISGPNGLSLAATLVSVDSNTSGPQRTATYKVVAPDGLWDANDSGAYQVQLLDGQVSDSSGNFVAAATLGSFTVNVAPPTTFSEDPTFGDLANYQLTTASRWSLAEDGGDTRLFLNTSNFSGTPNGIPTELALATGKTFGDFTLKMQARANESLSGNPKADYGVVFGYRDANNFLFACLRADAGGSNIYQIVNGQLSVLGSAAAGVSAFTDTAFHQVEVNRAGPMITVSVDGQQIMQGSDPLAAAVGQVGVTSYNDSAYFDNITVSDSLPLTGTLSVSDTTGDTADLTLQMPETTMGSVSAVESFTLANTGDSALTISNLAVGGTNPGDFTLGLVGPNGAVVDPASFTIAAGSEVTLQFSFAPTATGARSASVSFSTDDPANANVALQLTGNALAAPDTAAPTAQLSGNVGTADAAGYQFAVVYSDNAAVDPASIGAGDIVIAGPNGLSLQAALLSVDSTEAGPQRTATYQVVAPDGTWDFNDNGTYQIQLLDQQVADSSGNYAAATALGSFTVNATAPTVFSSNPVTGDLSNYDLTDAAHWQVAQDGGDARLALTGSPYSGPGNGALGQMAILQGQSYGDFTFTMEARTAEDLANNNRADYAVVFGYQDTNNYSFVIFRNDLLKIYRVSNGKMATLGTARTPAFKDSNYHDIQVSRVGTTVAVQVDGQNLLTETDSRLGVAGRIGVGSYNDLAYFDNLEIA